MSGNEERPGEFEAHARRVLDEGVARVSGRVRSRLNQARHAALAEIEAGSSSSWRASWLSFLRRPALMPATGAVAAAALVAVVLFTQQGGERALPGGQAAYEDIELLSDNDGLELIENFDGSFYEWAASQGDVSDGGVTG